MQGTPVDSSSKEEQRAAKLVSLQARALEPLIDLIAESFVHSLPPEVATLLALWLATPAGRAAFPSSDIIDAQFDALRELQR